ncbi:bifunctional hydroxymethylpyrimidine kinase/phosphomethylpyrimidine kinase [Gracilibacillus sp. S3-1-1]|uniref:Bifunctional hydroxymethylpyrimidine kinase/phosphomethylpyrimidine kinase n=1 Tax=Gracilibacillus pellucidus TaxID=3095368 RepID=A0ACC6M638_9BACI|nr:bifunctional hydroxymethylpyrimidine kinase/phosphomethylpyrimidine kinase [Gracilibacillus sp. S3-1-1]MDX8046351.1 bifunctional hydroxymethylpyrimidine kinase/phosphomethylpyrimidine kinase [Gracilibacillus sp. S3-1-1]
MKRVVTIAGAAAQGSAGIQADLKTFQERDVYGMSVITATVANNSKTSQGIFIRDIEEIEAQFYAATEMVGLDALKTGMLFSREIIEKVSELLQDLPVRYKVIDPVMIGKMGSQLLADDAIEVLKEQLIPQATIITPNRLEAEKLLEEEIPREIEALKAATKKLYGLGPQSVLLKAGSVEDEAIDIFYDGQEFTVFRLPLVETIHTSGAGCTFAACLTAELAKEVPMIQAIEMSKQFVYKAIKHALSFGTGIGSVRHGAFRQKNEHVLGKQ